MTVAEKIKEYLRENGLSQKQFCDISLIPTSNLSNILKGNQDITLTMGIRAARVMGVLLDDLVNDDLDWPLPKGDERPLPLTNPERDVLQAARLVSRFDPQPAQLATALHRLLGLDKDGPGISGGQP
jgi:transcriptional regulator with XRE-family HTH domain